jgi:hypothetical protein
VLGPGPRSIWVWVWAWVWIRAFAALLNASAGVGGRGGKGACGGGLNGGKDLPSLPLAEAIFLGVLLETLLDRPSLEEDWVPRDSCDATEARDVVVATDSRWPNVR